MTNISAIKLQESEKKTLAVILAGGSGSRLKSLTNWHSKPAVPFGGKYRSIDFPLSNCINSNIRKVCILTQYKSHSLNTHINWGWSFLRHEIDEYIELVPAQQRIKNEWYQGTADAIYQNLDIIEQHQPEYVLVLAGDHVYKMDYRLMLEQHIDTASDITIGCIEVPLADASSFGVLDINAENRITAFVEKPDRPKPAPHNPALAMASMGIYIFNATFLSDILKNDAGQASSSHDFGADIIPSLINSSGHRVSGYNFVNTQTGEAAYWRDVGTVDAYYNANIELCSVTPRLNLYDQDWPILTYQEQLPPAKFVFNDDKRRGYAVDSLISAGCIISGSKIDKSVIFSHVSVNSYSDISQSIILNNARIGRNCRIRRTIIDRDCNIPANTVIGYDSKADQQRFFVSPEGITLVSKEMLEANSDATTQQTYRCSPDVAYASTSV